MICISNMCILFYSKEKIVEIARMSARFVASSQMK